MDSIKNSIVSKLVGEEPQTFSLQDIVKGIYTNYPTQKSKEDFNPSSPVFRSNSDSPVLLEKAERILGLPHLTFTYKGEKYSISFDPYANRPLKKNPGTSEEEYGEIAISQEIAKIINTQGINVPEGHIIEAFTPPPKENPSREDRVVIQLHALTPIESPLVSSLRQYKTIPDSAVIKIQEQLYSDLGFNDLGFKDSSNIRITFDPKSGSALTDDNKVMFDIDGLTGFSAKVNPKKSKFEDLKYIDDSQPTRLRGSIDFANNIKEKGLNFSSVKVEEDGYSFLGGRRMSGSVKVGEDTIEFSLTSPKQDLQLTREVTFTDSDRQVKLSTKLLKPFIDKLSEGNGGYARNTVRYSSIFGSRFCTIDEEEWQNQK